MFVTSTGLCSGQGSATGQRFPALLWALLHVPIFLWLFAPGIAAAIRATPEAYRAVSLAHLPAAGDAPRVRRLAARAARSPSRLAPTGTRRPPRRRSSPRAVALDAQHLPLGRLPPERVLLPGPPAAERAHRGGRAGAGRAPRSSPRRRRSSRADVAAGAWFVRAVRLGAARLDARARPGAPLGRRAHLRRVRA